MRWRSTLILAALSRRCGAILHSGAFLWAHLAVDVGQRLCADKPRLAPAQWVKLLDEYGFTEGLAQAFMAEAETPVEELAAAKIDSMLLPEKLPEAGLASL